MAEQTWEFVQPEEADIPAMMELTRLVHGDVGCADPDYFRWLTAENPAGQAINWVAKEVTTGHIIAIALGIAVDFQLLGDEGTARYPLNLLVHPNFRRRGIVSALGCHVLDDYEEQGAALGYGSPGPGLENAWRNFELSVVGRPPLLVRPLDVSRLLSGWGIPGEPLHGLAGLGYRLCKPVLGSYGPVDLGARLHLEDVGRFGGRFDRFWEKAKHKHPIMPVRDASFLQWRYRDDPLRKYDCLACCDLDGEVVGYTIFKSVRLKNVETGMILDLLIESSQRGRFAGLALLAAATEALERAGSAVVVCRMLRHTEEYRLLRRRGYLPCPTRWDPWPITLIGRAYTIPLDVFTNLENWFYTLGDWGIDAFSA
jgi:ribosomal protein S18 acetylase RimI-like enzyme